MTSVTRSTPALRLARAPLKREQAASLQSAASRASALLRSLANPDRLMLMCELVGAERCVSDLADATGIVQPSLSQQLGVLRDEGLVATRREGKFIYYGIASPEAAELLKLLHRLYCEPSKEVLA